MPTLPVTNPLTLAATRDLTEMGAVLGGSPSAPAWSPLSLFANGEQGVWYDPSDLSTMFQNAAGTIPVTAVGQPVARILDKSGRGNHAYRIVTSQAPTLQQDGNGNYYLAFDGADDYLAADGIDFTATDKMTVAAGLTKLSDSLTRIIAELSTSAATNNGAWHILVPPGTGSYRFHNRGTAQASVDASGYAAPHSAVITATGDISGDSSILRVNQVQAASGSDLGVGNYGNYALYIGRRAGSTLPFNGRLYQLIVRGALTADLAPIESFIADKTGITL